MSHSEAFNATAKSGPQAYGREFEKQIQFACSTKSGNTHVLFLDKNHPPNGLNRVIKDLKDFVRGSGVSVKKLYLVPDCPKGSVPGFEAFSDRFLTQIYSWGQCRTTHETLDNSDPTKMVDVQTMFLGMNRNLSFDSQFLKDKQLDGYLKVPMSKESINLDSELFNAVKTNIKQFSGIGNKDNEVNVTNLLKLLKTNQQEL